MITRASIRQINRLHIEVHTSLNHLYVHTVCVCVCVHILITLMSCVKSPLQIFFQQNIFFFLLSKSLTSPIHLIYIITEERSLATCPDSAWAASRRSGGGGGGDLGCIFSKRKTHFCYYRNLKGGFF